MSAHTEGRLVTADEMHSAASLRMADSQHIAVACYLTPEDARRLAACWNACQGMTTESIEALSTLGTVGDLAGTTALQDAERYRLLRQEREEFYVVIRGDETVDALHGDDLDAAVDSLRVEAVVTP